MRPTDRPRAARLACAIEEYGKQVRPLLGISSPAHLDCLVEQIVESRRRIEYVHAIRDKRHDPRRMDPRSDLFDPLKAAVLHHRAGRVDEAFWLVFLATHFGKHAVDGWKLTRTIYGRLGGTEAWNWSIVAADPSAFRQWTAANQEALRAVPHRFSNHRKYESVTACGNKGTAAAIESYVAWVAPPRTHAELIRAVHSQIGQNPQETFDHMYRSMNLVMRFGRLGKFDYLNMLGKLGLAPIEPGSAYLIGATGPLRGVRLLFGGAPDTKIPQPLLDGYLAELDTRLNIGMQAMEDSLCNWQKSPSRFVSFRG